MLGKKIITLLSLVFFLVLGGVIYQGWLNKKIAPEKRKYFTTTINMELNNSFVTLPGKIIKSKQIEVKADTEGRVTKVFVKTGDIVEEGQVLALLDISQERLQEFELLSKFKKNMPSPRALKKNLREIRQLEKVGFYSFEEAAKKRSTVMSSLADVSRLITNLENAKKETNGKIVRAPFNGSILKVGARVGELFNPRDREKEAFFTMSENIFDSAIELEADDQIINKIKIGNKIRLTHPIYQELSFNGEVMSIDKAVTETRKLSYFKVIAKINSDKSDSLISGQRLMANVFIGKEDNKVLVPVAALDLKIPDQEISKEISLLPADSNIRLSGKTKHKKPRLVDGLAKKVARKIASEAFPHGSYESELYLLTGENKVVKARVLVGKRSGDSVFVYSDALIDSRVIIHVQ